MKLSPYLSLDGRCEEAIKFYEHALGAKVSRMMRFKDHPDPQPGMFTAGNEDKIMHAHLKIGDQDLMLSDGRCAGKPVFQGVTLSMTVNTDAEAESTFRALLDGGHVAMPLATTFFASKFGMLADKFGVHWMVLTDSPPAKSDRKPVAAKTAKKAKK